MYLRDDRRLKLTAGGKPVAYLRSLKACVHSLCVKPRMHQSMHNGSIARAASTGVTAEEVEKRLSANTVIGRIVDAEEIAYVAAFLASPKSVAITGDAIAAGGGIRGAIHY